MAEDKCAGDKAKMNETYDDYKEAKEQAQSLIDESNRLSDIVTEKCDVLLLEGKTGKKFWRIVKSCKSAQEKYNKQGRETKKAMDRSDRLGRKYNRAQDKWKRCEHKKKSGGK